jgi:TPR repeat protein
MRATLKTLGLALGLVLGISPLGVADDQINLPPSLQDLNTSDVIGAPLYNESMARALRAWEIDDYENALTYAENAAAAGSPEGALLAGHILLHGLSQRGQDDDLAVRWLRRAAERGDSDANVILSRLASAERGGLSAFQAYDFLTTAADSGDALAAHELGIYLMERGDPGAASAAVDWLRLAAESGRVEAYNDLAFALSDWVHGPRNLTLARRWYERAGENGNAYGALMAGAMHLSGDGQNANPELGVRLIQQAAELGHSAAMGEFALLLFQGAPGLPANPSAAANWALRGAQAGDSSAQYLYAYALAKGDGATINYEQSYVWTLRAGQGTDSLAADPDRQRLQRALEGFIPAERLQILQVEALTNPSPLF